MLRKKRNKAVRIKPQHVVYGAVSFSVWILLWRQSVFLAGEDDSYTGWTDGTYAQHRQQSSRKVKEQQSLPPVRRPTVVDTVDYENSYNKLDTVYGIDFENDIPTYPKEVRTKHPRVVLLDGHDPSYVPAISWQGQEKRKRYSVIPLSHGNILSYSPSATVKPYMRPFQDDCKPMTEWQTQHFPTCNVVHEVDPYKPVLLSMDGSWRSVWKVRDASLQHDEHADNAMHRNHQNNQNVVLKMLHFRRNYTANSFRHSQVDAVAMERLSSSPFVVNAYGFCGQSVLTEWAPAGGRDAIKSSKLSSRQRLVLAYQLAVGLHHIHSIDYRHGLNATLAHNDINVANIVSIGMPPKERRDGAATTNTTTTTHSKGGGLVLKYNDFNIATPLRWNASSDRPCGYPVVFENHLWRSPEEIQNTSYISEKTDVYALGNLLFQVLTKHQPWTWLEPDGKLPHDEVARRKQEGILPFVPDKVRESSKIPVQALYWATLACYRVDPHHRPTAYRIANGLLQALRWIDADRKKTMPVEDIRRLFDVPATATDSNNKGTEHRGYNKMDGAE